MGNCHSQYKNKILKLEKNNLNNKINVFVIDDDDLELEIIHELFSQDNDFTVLIINEHIEFWEIVKEHQCDILLVDIHMPNFEIFTFLDKMKKIHPQIPIIVLTADTDETLMKKCFDHGAVDYLVKPLTQNNINYIKDNQEYFNRKKYFINQEQNTTNQIITDSMMKIERQFNLDVLYKIKNELGTMKKLDSQINSNQNSNKCKKVIQMIDSLIKLNKIENGDLENETKKINLLEMIPLWVARYTNQTECDYDINFQSNKKNKQIAINKKLLKYVITNILSFHEDKFGKSKFKIKVQELSDKVLTWELINLDYHKFEDDPAFLFNKSSIIAKYNLFDFRLVVAQKLINFLDSKIEIFNEESNKFLTSYVFVIKYLDYVDNQLSITDSDSDHFDIKQVLIIDNKNDDIFMVIEEYIKNISPNCKTKISSNGESAIKLLSNKYDIIFVRNFYEAKLWNGKDIIHHIRKLEKQLNLPPTIIVAILDQNIKIDFIKYTNEGCDLILYSPLPQKETFKQKILSSFYYKK